MIIRIAADRQVRVEDAANFKKFKVACDLPATRFSEVADANPAFVRFEDEKTAWVAIAALRSWSAVASDKAWQDGHTAMIEAAAPHGWISPDKTAIKAHVEWAA